MIYLASPYSHPEEAVREDRFKAACVAAGSMMQRGEHVFSPIAHTHPIAVECDLPLGWEYWQEYDVQMIRACSAMVVLMIDGWGESKGIAAEIKIALAQGIPVRYMTYIQAVMGLGWNDFPIEIKGADGCQLNTADGNGNASSSKPTTQPSTD